MIEKLLACAKENNILIEVLERKHSEASIQILNKTKFSDETVNITTYLVKGVIGNKVVSLELEDIQDCEKIIEQLKENAILIDKEVEYTFSSDNNCPSINKNKKTYNKEELAKSLFKTNNFYSKYSNLANIEIICSYIEYQINIKNSLGLSLTNENSYYDLGVEISCEENGHIESEILYLFDNKFIEKNILNKIEKGIQNCQLKLNANLVSSKKYNVILSNKVTYDILDSFSTSFFAKNIKNKTSVFSDSFKQKIGSELLTIIEDPQASFSPVTRTFDNEGVLTSKKSIVVNGVFQTKLYDKKSASEENMVSTGNSYGVLNMYIKPGTHSLKELFTEVKDGIYIDSVSGIHAGIDNISGDISLQATGYEIKEGKINTAIRDLVISTNIKELFSNIKMIADDLEIFSFSGGSPSILVENISIAGSK